MIRTFRSLRLLFDLILRVTLTVAFIFTLNISYADSIVFSDGETLVVDSLTVATAGTRITTEPNSNGIELIGNYPGLILLGSVETRGNESLGIDSRYPNTSITISETRSVTTLGLSSKGILSLGTETMIINNGAISTIGQLGNGISFEGDNTSVVNNGYIETVGNFSDGIQAFVADFSIINNLGTIIVSGERSDGVSSLFGEYINIDNSGFIETTGHYARGIESSGNFAVVKNSGNIKSTGRRGAGIYLGGLRTVLDNNGSIIATGNTGFGIWVAGNDTIINNSGLISATGENSFAFLTPPSAMVTRFTNNSFAVLAQPQSRDTISNILSGSQIIGRIDLGDGGDNDIANVFFDGGLSRSLTFENTETINVFGSAMLMGNTVVAVDPTGESTRGVILAGLTGAIHNVISRRVAQGTAFKSVQLASLDLSPDLYFEEEQKSVAWYEVFGGQFDRDAEDNALGYEYDYSGINFGYEWDYDGARLGLVGGIVRTDADTEKSSFSTDADNYYLGAYGHHKLDNMGITISMLAGYGDQHNDRLVLDNVNGREFARSAFDSWFF